MQEKYSIKRRYKLLLPLMFVAWLMMLLQSMPHHHHADARLCMDSPEAHCQIDCHSEHNGHQCQDLEPCNKHFDIGKPRLEQEQIRPQMQLIAVLMEADDLLPNSLINSSLKGYTNSPPELYSSECAKAIGLRAPPYFLQTAS